MPDIRIMNWNIQQLSSDKARIPSMAKNIGKVIVKSRADIVLIVEVTSGCANVTMKLIAEATNAIARQGGDTNDYKAWIHSYNTGGECYGVLIRNLNVIRPIVVSGGPSGAGTNADDAAALTNLDRNKFRTWLGTFRDLRNAYPKLPDADRPDRLPLINVYASTAPGDGRNAEEFAGRALAAGGNSEGRGFRMPCLAMFEIRPLLRAETYFVPIVICHLGAVRGGINHLAQGQIQQYKDTDIAQRFQAGRYVNLNNVARPVQNLIFTGDFNVDFLKNRDGGDHEESTNRGSFNHVTPTAANGGLALPLAMPAAPIKPRPRPPFARPADGWPAGPKRTDIPVLALKAGVTTRGTIYKTSEDYGQSKPPMAIGACFDHFYFGGADLADPLVYALANAGGAEVLDLMPLIGQDLDVTQLWRYFSDKDTRAANTRDGRYLIEGVARGLHENLSRLIGARFISDHLPTVMQFNLPD